MWTERDGCVEGWKGTSWRRETQHVIDRRSSCRITVDMKCADSLCPTSASAPLRLHRRSGRSPQAVVGAVKLQSCAEYSQGTIRNEDVCVA